MRIALILCLVAVSALADDAARLEVAVGETVEREVGIALGLRCDDVAIVRVALHTVTPASNVFEVTGVAPGTTLCRVGTALNRPSFVFEIHVVRARAPS
jgi:hypothetical protein